MLEKMKLLMLLVFTIDFLAFCVLIGNLYDRMGLPRNVWIIICGILTVVLAVIFIMDVFFVKRKAE